MCVVLIPTLLHPQNPFESHPGSGVPGGGGGLLSADPMDAHARAWRAQTRGAASSWRDRLGRRARRLLAGLSADCVSLLDPDEAARPTLASLLPTYRRCSGGAGGDDDTPHPPAAAAEGGHPWLRRPLPARYEAALAGLRAEQAALDARARRRRSAAGAPHPCDSVKAELVLMEFVGRVFSAAFREKAAAAQQRGGRGAGDGRALARLTLSPWESLLFGSWPAVVDAYGGGGLTVLGGGDAGEQAGGGGGGSAEGVGDGAARGVISS